jgi:hypothetical protein
MRSVGVVRMRHVVIPLQRPRALSVRQRLWRSRREAARRFGARLRGGVFGHAYRVDWLLLCNTLFNGTLYLDGCQGYAHCRRKAVSSGRGTLRPICVVGKRNVDVKWWRQKSWPPRLRPGRKNTPAAATSFEDDLSFCKKIKRAVLSTQEKSRTNEISVIPQKKKIDNSNASLGRLRRFII